MNSNNTNINDVKNLILKDFEIEEPLPEISEEEFLYYLSQHIEYMFEKKMEFLLSMLYRMDVNETKINQALHPASKIPAHIGISKLIIERHKKRIWTKKNIHSPKLSDWDDGIFKS